MSSNAQHIFLIQSNQIMFPHIISSPLYANSCNSQLLITLDDLYATFDKKIKTEVDILEFSRAFDTVPHERLLGKLAHYGFQGRTNSWIRAFLTGRSMSVVMDGESSGPTPFLSGVAQGTVVGLLLILIYINDMPSQVSKGTCIRLFADDCLVHRRIQNVNDQAILQQDLDSLPHTSPWVPGF